VKRTAVVVVVAVVVALVVGVGAVARHELTEADEHNGADPGYVVGGGLPGWVYVAALTGIALYLLLLGIVIVAGSLDYGTAGTMLRRARARQGRHRIRYATGRLAAITGKTNRLIVHAPDRAAPRQSTGGAR
jgi:hypothetical protein